jgi:cytochrome c-type biogenesis protein CcmE
MTAEGGAGIPDPMGLNQHDDDESIDAATPSGFDLTPRTSSEATRPRNSRRTVLAVGVLGAIVAAVAVVLFNGLRDASTFFYNVDEAVAKQSELGESRFRMQGNVVPGSVSTDSDGVDFVIAYKGAKVPVHHEGDPPELFGPKIPVVIEGQFSGKKFSSDQILIRHDNTYDEKNADRVRQAQRDAEQRASG